MEHRTCHFCGNRVEKEKSCAVCVRNFPRLPDPHKMTGHERAKELRQWLGVLEIPFRMTHERVSALVGRDVWTHEMCSENLENLIEEARTWKHEGQGPLEAIERLGLADRTIIVGTET